MLPPLYLPYSTCQMGPLGKQHVLNQVQDAHNPLVTAFGPLATPLPR